MTRKKVKFFPLRKKNKKKISFFSAKTKNISSHMLKVTAISLVLRTREITDIFNTSMAYIWYSPQKSQYPLYIICLISQKLKNDRQIKTVKFFYFVKYRINL